MYCLGAQDIEATNDLNIRTATASNISFQTNGHYNRLTIAKDGNVGIGTTLPREKLAVDGAIIVGDADNKELGTIKYVDGHFWGRTPFGWKRLDN